VKYGTIVADPPWRYTKNTARMRTDTPGRGAPAEAHYQTMEMEEMAALPVAEMAADKAHLYLWVTNPVLTEQRERVMGSMTAAGLCKAWGFEPKTLLTWVKTTAEGKPKAGGLGWYFRGATEHVVFATRGDLGIPAAMRQPNVFLAPPGRHSEKPDAFMDLVEMVSPDPRLEMFSRRARFGWDVWGSESLGTAALG
jgi:N6-adenosine-specific RNA methylase IME4